MVFDYNYNINRVYKRVSEESSMIFLKRLEAQGFKSFAEPIDISFEHSLIGIVGPNGCGKSNINDAIRWCLGETINEVFAGQ